MLLSTLYITHSTHSTAHTTHYSYTQVGPYHLPSGTPVYYSLHSAMRDPTTFLEPDQFLPGRWREKEGRERNLAFSTGIPALTHRSQLLIYTAVSRPITPLIQFS